MDNKKVLIDFNGLFEIIPDNGSISLTVKKNKDGKLGVLFKTNHNLSSKPSVNDKELKGTGDAVEKASKVLEKVISFADSPEKLTASFAELITKKAAAAKTLETAINEVVAELNESIKDLKAKKAPAKTTKVKDKAKGAPRTIQGKTEEKKTEAGVEGHGLFWTPVGEPDGAATEGVSQDKKETGKEVAA